MYTPHFLNPINKSQNSAICYISRCPGGTELVFHLLQAILATFPLPLPAPPHPPPPPFFDSAYGHPF